MPDELPVPPLTRVDAIACFRISDYDTPLWDNPNSRAGRWNSAGEAPTQYFALDAPSAWAEIVCFNELKTEEEAAMLRTSVWVCRLTSYQLVDYRTFDAAQDAGFPPEALVDDDYTACREHARELRHMRVDGIIAPSAALPGSRCLTLFGPRVASAWNSDARLTVSMPTTHAAIGAPPGGIVEHVRHYGTRHETLENWLAGHPPPQDLPESLF
jgi:RES domain-containing protein